MNRAALPGPSLALVIGSGGVRSVAALGVAEVLMDHGLAPDLIAGSSAGAIFGALIAAGHSPRQALQLASRLWSPELTQQRRWGALPQMLMPRLLRFSPDFALRDDRLILERMHAAFGEAELQELPHRLRVNTTCAATGRAVVLDHGSVVEALRASIGLPFMFSPQRLGERRLIDGFVSDPLPVSAVADAHTIVAVGVHAPIPQHINRPSRLLAQVHAAMTNNLMQARLAAAGEHRVISIFPQLEQRVGLFDTAAMPALVEAGRRAARAQLPALQLALARAA
jgi:NTE family protein